MRVLINLLFLALWLLQSSADLSETGECAQPCKMDATHCHDSDVCMDCVSDGNCPGQTNPFDAKYVCPEYCSRHCDDTDTQCLYSQRRCAWTGQCEACNNHCLKCKSTSSQLTADQQAQHCQLAERHCFGNGRRCGRHAGPKGMADFGEFDGEPVHSTNGLMVIQMSQSTLYGIMAVVILLLITNISCLFYMNCSKKKQRRYSKVAVVGSSEDEMRI